MTLYQAAIIFATHLMDTTCQVDPSTNQCMPYDHQVMENVVAAITEVTEDVQEAETLIRISRYESGGFRRDIVDCVTRGDHGMAQGAFQVHPFSKKELKTTCSKDYREQAAVALERVRDSIAICKRHGFHGSDLLGQYTSGRCSKNNPSAYLRWGSGKELQELVFTEIEQAFPRVEK